MSQLVTILSEFNLTKCKVLLLIFTVGLISEEGFMVNAANCEFKTNVDKTNTTIWIIRGEPISEHTPERATIWSVETENIVGSAYSPVPHGKYLSGTRRTTQYEYKTTSVFSEFITNERALEVQRNVTFTCEDGSEQYVHFQFPLIDVNEAPEFTVSPKQELQVNLLQVDETTIINEDEQYRIAVRDRDFDPANNNVVVTSDRGEFLNIALREDSDPKRIGKLFHVDLNLNNLTVPEGKYNVNLFCSDGKLTSSTTITINIFKQ